MRGLHSIDLPTPFIVELPKDARNERPSLLNDPLNELLMDVNKCCFIAEWIYHC